MQRPNNPRVDLTARTGNPSSWIQEHYQELMAITDPHELAETAIAGMRAMVGRGFSEPNFRKLLIALQQSERKGLVAVQKYLTNFMLAGAGMRTEDDARLAIATMITEDVEPIQLSPQQRDLKKLVESYGYSVAMIEG